MRPGPASMGAAAPAETVGTVASSNSHGNADAVMATRPLQESVGSTASVAVAAAVESMGSTPSASPSPTMGSAEAQIVDGLANVTMSDGERAPEVGHPAFLPGFTRIKRLGGGSFGEVFLERAEVRPISGMHVAVKYQKLAEVRFYFRMFETNSPHSWQCVHDKPVPGSKIVCARHTRHGTKLNASGS